MGKLTSKQIEKLRQKSTAEIQQQIEKERKNHESKYGKRS